MDFGFLIKKVVGVLAAPLPFFFFLLFFAYFFFRHGKANAAKWTFILSVASLTFFSLPITSRILIQPIEFSHPKLAIENPQYIESLGVGNIVVLGCYHSEDELLPLVAKIDQCSLPRVVQGVQIWRKIPNSKLIFSGYGGKEGKPSNPKVHATLAMELGVPEGSIVLIEGTKDTQHEAIKLKEMVGEKSLIVISSASHIPRVKYIFSGQNINAIYSPSEYVSRHGELSWHDFIPNSSSLHQSERAIYEILGNLWVRIKRFLQS